MKRIFAVACATLLAAMAGQAKNETHGSWSLFVDFTFTAENDAISDSDRTKPRRVAQYLEGHPALQVGLDGMHLGRVSSVRAALIDAGIPSSRIRIGAFGEPHLRGERRVLVMLGP